MAEFIPQYRFGLSIGVSHYLQELLEKTPVFSATEVGSALFDKVVDAEAESAVARRILELANVEPPLLTIPDLNMTHIEYRSFGQGDYFLKYVHVARVDGPLNAPELVGVSDTSNHFFALNRVDVVSDKD